MNSRKKELTCIVCDDLESMRTLFQGILESLGLKVHLAKNGREGCDLVAALCAKGTAPDVVFIDMMMPEMNGIAATQEMRGNGYTGPILAFSAHVARETSAKATAAGVSHYFLKSTFNVELAKALLERHCDVEF